MSTICKRFARAAQCSVVGIISILLACDDPSSADKAQIKSLYERFEKALADGDYTNAYALMHWSYRQQHSLEQFKLDNFRLFTGDSPAVRSSSSVVDVQKDRFVFWVRIRRATPLLSLDHSAIRLYVVHDGQWYFTGKKLREID